MKRFLGIWALMAIFMAALLPAGLLSVWLSVRKQAKELEQRVRELETNVSLLQRERQENN